MVQLLSINLPQVIDETKVFLEQLLSMRFDILQEGVNRFLFLEAIPRIYITFMFRWLSGEIP